jgi:mannose-6-phosphate isomerase-like protein (cupin superfamily)
MKMNPIVRYLDETQAVPCPYGDVRRVVTGGEGTANIHVVSVTKGGEHYHKAYDEVYYFLSGTGSMTINAETYPVRPGTVAVIPAEAIHALFSDTDAPLVFIIIGTPPMPIGDERAAPQKQQPK